MADAPKRTKCRARTPAELARRDLSWLDPNLPVLPVARPRRHRQETGTDWPDVVVIAIPVVLLSLLVVVVLGVITVEAGANDMWISGARMFGRERWEAVKGVMAFPTGVLLLFVLTAGFLWAVWVMSIVIRRTRQ